jgi:exopolysaccharide biosynthesis operon protein EpsL
LLGAPGAHAFFDDRFQLYVSETVNHDDNILRLSSNPFPEQGGPRDIRTGGDTFFVTGIGGRIVLPYGNHRFFADAQVIDERYRRFTDLDFRGHDARAEWEWKVPDRWASRVAYLDQEKLGEFADQPLLLRVKNELRIKEALGEANWTPTGVFRLRGYISERQQRNGDPLLRQNDIDVRTYDVSGHYPIYQTGWIGGGYRLEKGEYPQRIFESGSLFDNAYEQRHPYVAGERDLFGHSRVSFRIGPIEREYRNRPERNVDDTAYRFVYDWKPTFKTSVQFIAVRDISVVEEVATNFVRIRGFAVRPEWRATEKITVSAAYDYTLRDYLGSPGFVVDVPVADGTRRDKLHILSLSARWIPLKYLELLASASRERRTSTFDLGDYDVTLFSLQAKLTF